MVTWCSVVCAAIWSSTLHVLQSVPEEQARKETVVLWLVFVSATVFCLWITANDPGEDD